MSREIKVLSQPWNHAKMYNLFANTDEMFAGMPDSIPEAARRKEKIIDELSKYPNFDIFRITHKDPYQGVFDESESCPKENRGRLQPLYTCYSDNDGYRGTDGRWSQTWSGYYLLQDTGAKDAENHTIYRLPDERHIVFKFNSGSPSSWSSIECHEPRF